MSKEVNAGGRFDTFLDSGNIFQSLLMFYYIIKLKRISESGIRTRIQKDFYVLMKLRNSICFASIVQMHTRKQNYN